MCFFSPPSPWSWPARWSETSAMPWGLRASVPLKMTSCMLEPRSIFALCSPRTQLMASPILDFPQPLGPTTAVIPSGKITSVVSENDLNPEISIFSIFSMVSAALVSGGNIHRARRGTQRTTPTFRGIFERPPLDLVAPGEGLSIPRDEQVRDPDECSPRGTGGKRVELSDRQLGVKPRASLAPVQGAALVEQRD